MRRPASAPRDPVAAILARAHREENLTLVTGLCADPYLLDLRELPDGAVAYVSRLMHGTGLHTQCDRAGYGRRFVYLDALRALDALAGLRHGQDYPRSGWVSMLGRPLDPIDPPTQLEAPTP